MKDTEMIIRLTSTTLTVGSIATALSGVLCLAGGYAAALEATPLTAVFAVLFAACGALLLAIAALAVSLMWVGR